MAKPRQKKLCLKCNREISLSNFEKHEKICTGEQKDSKINLSQFEITEDGKYICPTCSKQFSKNGISSHYWRLHGDGQGFVPFGSTLGHEAWNKGKTKESDPRLAKQGETFKQRGHKPWSTGLPKDDPRLVKMSQNISRKVSQKVKDGEWHVSLAKNMHHPYNGVDFHGTWELLYAKFLDQKNVRWQRCKERFSYTYENKVRYYTPDFYLPDTNEYVEIKGYETEKDKIKWSQFPGKLIVLKEKDLKQLGLI